MTKLRVLSIGERVGCWTVLNLLPNRYYSCKCDCGIEQKVRAHDLLTGKSKLCRSCSISLSKRSHGASTGEKKTQEYISWQKMISRCTNPEDKDYPNYGGRGITVCDMWLDSFESFLLSMGKAPKGYTIDRKDTNGNYIPGNCVWGDRTQQSRNRRNNVRITYKGQTKVASEWMEELGITNSNSFYKRLSRHPDEDPNKMFEEFIKEYG